MRILIYISSLAGGGAERVVANLANHWAEKGWDVFVVTLAPSAPDDYVLHRSINRVSLNLACNSSNFVVGVWRNTQRIDALRNVLSEIRPDVAMGIMTEANIHLALAGIMFPSMCLIGTEHVYPPRVDIGVGWGWLRRVCYGRLAAVVTLTNECSDWIKRNTAANMTPVIPNPIVKPLRSPPPYLAPSAIRVEGRHLLLAVGRLHGQKGFDLLVSAFSSLANKYFDWDLVVLGEGKQRDSLERQAALEGLESRVFFPGRAGNVADWYMSADLYVMSSRYEGFPNTLIEALAYGVPVVSFDCETGPRDIVRDGIDGFLVPPGDVTSLARALDKLMGNSDERARCARRAVEVNERFSIDRIASMWEKLFMAAMK